MEEWPDISRLVTAWPLNLDDIGSKAAKELTAHRTFLIGEIKNPVW